MGETGGLFPCSSGVCVRTSFRSKGVGMAIDPTQLATSLLRLSTELDRVCRQAPKEDIALPKVQHVSHSLKILGERLQQPDVTAQVTAGIPEDSATRILEVAAKISPMARRRGGFWRVLRPTEPHVALHTALNMMSPVLMEVLPGDIDIPDLPPPVRHLGAFLKSE